mgnify:FL=1
MNGNSSTEKGLYPAHNARELEALAGSTGSFPVATTNYIYDIQSSVPVISSSQDPGVSEAIKNIKKVRRKISRMGKRPTAASAASERYKAKPVGDKIYPDWTDHMAGGGPV